MATKAQLFSALLSSQRASGVTLSGGKVYFYVPGSVTLKTIYADRNKQTPAANPYTLDSNGQASVYGDGLYDVQVKNNTESVSLPLWEDVSIIDISAAVDSVTNYANLEAAVSAIGSTKTTLIVGTDQSVVNNLTVPPTLELQIANGAIITVASTKTLTINGPFNAGLYLVFAGSGTVSINKAPEIYPEWFGAEGDDTDDDSAAITKAIASAVWGKLVLTRTYRTLSPITIDKPLRVVGGGEIHQATSNATAFVVTSDDVQFDSIIITGNNGTPAATDYTDYQPVSYATLATTGAGIYAPGTVATQRKNITVQNCRISGFHYCVFALWNDGLVAQNNILTNCFVGIQGGAGYEGAYTTEQNITTQSYTISKNSIIVTYGSKDYARPVTLPINGGAALIEGNYLRGGGMSFENTLVYFNNKVDTGYTRNKRIRVINNDMDSGVSVADIVSGNTFDNDLAPTGRGQQYGIDGSAPANAWWQAIEPAPNAIITNNIIRNHATGIANLGFNGTVITGNVFENIGTAITPQQAVIQFDTQNEVDVTSGTIISNNKFINIDAQPILNLQWSATHAFVLSNIVFSSNSVIGTDSYAMLLKNVKRLKIANNHFEDTNRLQNTNPPAIWESDGVEAYYDGNMFVRTLSTAYGAYNAIIVKGKSVIGTNFYTGLIGDPIRGDGVAPVFSTPVHTIDGAFTSTLRANAGSPSTVLTPAYVGEIVRDSTNDAFYIAYGAANTNWKLLTP